MLYTYVPTYIMRTSTWRHASTAPFRPSMHAELSHNISTACTNIDTFAASMKPGSVFSTCTQAAPKCPTAA